MQKNSERVVFLDWLRVIACFMVMLVHACENYYFNADGAFAISSLESARWATWIDSACRASVPLFVIASAFLLFPVKRTTGDFFRRRLLRVVVPFLVWTVVYTIAWKGDWTPLLFNFPMGTGGHMWFVPMLLGLYLLMPLLSPWAEKASEREVRMWIVLWLFTTTFPFLRKACAALCGDPPFGAIPYLYGECPWNGFGTFQYVSGFFGYMLIGFWFRKFAPELSWGKTLARALPLLVVGWSIVWAFFYYRIPVGESGYPVVKDYAMAVNLEMSWEFCSLGVVMTVVGYFLIIRKLDFSGAFYRFVVRPLSEASYGTYLMHMLILAVLVKFFENLTPCVPLAVFATAATTFIVASLCSVLLRRIPFIGRFIG